MKAPTTLMLAALLSLPTMALAHDRGGHGYISGIAVTLGDHDRWHDRDGGLTVIYSDRPSHYGYYAPVVYHNAWCPPHRHSHSHRHGHHRGHGHGHGRGHGHRNGRGHRGHD